MVDMTTINEIRRARLQELIDEVGGPKRLSDLIDRAPSQISQWLNASPDSKSGKPRQISSQSARYIEERCRKPVGWMDATPGTAESPAQHATAEQRGGTGNPYIDLIIQECFKAAANHPERLHAALGVLNGTLVVQPAAAAGAPVRYIPEPTEAELADHARRAALISGQKVERRREDQGRPGGDPDRRVKA